MRKIIILSVFGVFSFCAGNRGFTQEERNLIGSDPKAGVMRLWTTSSQQDSTLLRVKAIPMIERDVKSHYFDVLKQRMIATVTDPANEGVGIAAPQVGISRRLIAVQRFDQEGELFVFYVNPAIDWSSETQSAGAEGCLSVEGIRSEVMRSDTIIVSYDDMRIPGNRVTERITGFTAVIFQHEIDHLDGKLFTDYLTEEEEE